MPKITSIEVLVIDGVMHEKRPDGSFAPLRGESDWARVDAMSDQELTNIAARDEDAVEFREEDWVEAAAERRLRLADLGPSKMSSRKAT